MMHIKGRDQIIRFRKIFGNAQKNSIIDTVVSLTKRKIHEIRRMYRVKTIIIAEIEYEITMQLH